MTSKINIAKTLTAAAAIAGVILWAKFGVKTGVKGFYVNDYATTTAPVQATWLKKQGANLAALYHVTSDLTLNRTKVATTLYTLRKAGVQSIGYPYGSANNVTATLANYNKAVTDSSKFDFVVSEIEPYNTGDYASFYTTLRAVNTFAGVNNLQSCVYMGWPSEACWDTIVRNSSRIFLHCYRSSTAMSGGSQFGYINTRMSVIAAKAKAAKKKISIVVIYSAELTFAQNWFRSNTWQSTYESYLLYYTLHASPDVLQWTTQDGWMIFATSYAKISRP
jgi:hypothetical protein